MCELYFAQFYIKVRENSQSGTIGTFYTLQVDDIDSLFRLFSLYDEYKPGGTFA